jgi:hypothetical protein
MDPAQATVLFYDHGLFTHFALMLGRTGKFKRVLYYVPDSSPFPTSNLALIGTGYDEIERVSDLWKAVKEADLVVFADVYDGGLQEHLRDLGKLVWGCGGAEELELDRYEMKQLQKELGLPVQPVRLVKGLRALRKHLEPLKDKYIKISRTRGDMESWHWVDKDLSSDELDDLAVKLGPAAEVIEFLVEDPLNGAQETGCDWNFVNGVWAKRGLMTYEIKDCGCMGAVKDYKDLPKPVRLINDRFGPVLAAYKTAMWWSTEVRVIDGKGYFLDPCCRLGVPPSEMFGLMYSNWPEMLMAGAQGECVDPEPVAKYGFEAMIYVSDDVAWQRLRFPEKYRPYIALRNCCRINGIDVIPPAFYKLKAIGAVVGLADSIAEAVENCREVADAIEGSGLHIRLDSIGSAIKEIEEGEKQGLEFSDEALPKPEELMAA